MPITYAELAKRLMDDGTFEEVAINGLTQFGTTLAPMLGASLLPERNVPNSGKETDVKFRVMPALDGTRYSPTQMGESGLYFASFSYMLGDTDTKSQLTGQDYDQLVALLNSNDDQAAIAQAVRWADRTLLQPHLIKNEIQRWQALSRGVVTRRGSDGYQEDITYVTPAGHRPTVPGGTVATPAGWHAPAYSILSDLYLAKQVLADKGLRISGIFAPDRILGLMRRNTEIGVRAGSVIPVGATTYSFTGGTSNAAINQVLVDDGFPAVTIYDESCPTPQGQWRYINGGLIATATADFVVITAQTDLTATINVQGTGQEQIPELDNVLGYYGIGTNTGQQAAGRTITVEPQTFKPQGWVGESYQTGLPIIQRPDSLYVIRVNRPTP